MLVEMTRVHVVSVLCVLLAVHVAVAGLPHVHADEAVRVGALHVDHGDASGDDSCVTVPLEVVAASSCLACAVHAPQLTAPADSTGQVALPGVWRVAEVHDRPGDPPRPSAVRVRGPPPLV